MSECSDKTVLIAVLAYHLGFVSEAQLGALIQEWIEDRSQPFESLLRQQQYVDHETAELLRGLACKQLEASGGSLTASLNSLQAHEKAISPRIMASLTTGDKEDVWETLSCLVDGTTQDQPAPTHVSPQSPSSIFGRHSERGHRFNIVREHARGGLGQIFLAIDDELNRQVALKHIQGRFADDPDARHRFLLEAEITGGLEHPGVVPVYGLGMYSDGQPYYAMRFIRGESLDDAIADLHQRYPAPRNRWSNTPSFTSEMRRLMGRLVDVCQAIGYAHSRGVVHRDIKPANIMLGKFGETLVVDWGLAKASGRADAVAESPDPSTEPQLEPASNRDSAPTRMGTIVGTPGYMSPEQASGNIEELDARSDVYSLGATLYSVLLGRPAIGSLNDAGEVRGLEQVLRDIRNGSFPSPRQLDPTIPKPLAAICTRAMALNPAERYATPLELAEDIECWLADEPVTAYSESRIELARRWVKRHQTLAASGAAVVFVSIVALGSFSMVLRQKNKRLAELASSLQTKNNQLDERGRQLQQSNEDLRLAEGKARTEAETSNAVTKFLNDDLLSQASPQDHPNPQLQVRTVLDRAADSMHQQFASQPLVKAKLLKTIGVAYGYLGEYGKSKTSLAESVTLLSEQLGSENAQTLAAKVELGAVLALSGDYPQARSLLESTLERQIRSFGQRDKAVIDTQTKLAELYTTLGLYAKAERMLEQAVEGNLQLVGANHPDTLQAQAAQMNLWNLTYRLTEAAELGQQILASAQTALGPEHMVTLNIQLLLAQQMAYAEKFAAAKPVYQEVANAYARLLGDEHPITLAVQADLALIELEIGDPSRALLQLQAIAARLHDVFGDRHRETIVLQIHVANALRALGQVKPSADLLSRQVDLATEVLGESHPETQNARLSLAMSELALNHTAAAEALLRPILKARSKSGLLESRVSQEATLLLAEIDLENQQFEQAIRRLQAVRNGFAHMGLARLSSAIRANNQLLRALVASGRANQAEQILDDLEHAPEQSAADVELSRLTLVGAYLESGLPDRARTLLALSGTWIDVQEEPTAESLDVMQEYANLLLFLENHSEAIAVYRRLVDGRSRLQGAEHFDTLNSTSDLGYALEAEGQFEEAESTYRDAVNGYLKNAGLDSEQTLLAMEFLAGVQLRLGKTKAAVEWLEMLVQGRERLDAPREELSLLRHSLADVQRELGNYPAAIQAYEAVLSGGGETPVDADQLLVVHQLAWCLAQNGQATRAIAYYRRALEERTRLLGAAHEHTLMTASNLVQLLAAEAGPEESEAASVAEAAIEDLAARLGGLSPTASEFLDACYALGEAYRMMGQYSQATSWYQKSFAGRREILGAKHADTLLVLHQLAYTQELAGQLAKATELYAEVVAGREETLGKTHAYTLLSLNNWANLQLQRENFDEAIRLYTDLLQRRENSDGANSIDTLAPRAQLAVLYLTQQDYPQAILYFRQALELATQSVAKQLN